MNRCYACRAAIEGTPDTCSRCGAVQTYLCECGQTSSVYAQTCPACGAGVSAPLRSHQGRSRRPLVAAGILALAVGAVIALRAIRTGDGDARWRAFEDAWICYANGDYSGGHLRFRRFLESHGPDVRAEFMLGKCLEKLERVQEAREHYFAAAQLDPDFDEPTLALALLDFRAGDLHAALRGAEQALAHPPTPPEAHLLLARVLSSPGFRDVRRAIWHLNRARQLGMDNPELILLLGELSLLEARAGIASNFRSGSADYVERAAASIAKRLEAAPENPDLLFALAQCREFAGRADEAMGLLRKSIEAGGPTLPKQILLARLHFLRGNPALAEKVLEDSTSDGGDPRVAIQVAETYLHLLKPDRAEALLRRTIERSGPTAAVVALLAEILLSSERPEQANRLLSELEASGPLPSELVVLRAEALLATGRAEAARDTLEDGLQRLPESAPLLLRLAGLLLDTSGTRDSTAAEDRAAGLLDRVRSLPEDRRGDPSYLDYIEGRILLARGLLSDATRVLHELVARIPDFAQAWYALAIAGIRSGDDQAAITALDAAIACAAPSSEYHVTRGMVRLRLGRAAAAEEDARASLALGGTDRSSTVLLSDALLAQGKAEAALEVLRDAVETDPSPGELRVAKGRALTSLSRFEEAEAELHEVLERSSLPAERLAAIDALGKLADAREAQVHSRSSQETWRQYLEAHPEDVAAILRYSGICLASGDFEAALRFAERAVSLAPASPEAHTLRFDAAAMLSDAGRLSEILEDSSSRLPEGPPISYIRVKHAILTGDRTDSSALARAAADRYPNSSPLSLLAGEALLADGKPSEALPYLRRAVARDPESLPSRAILAMAAFREAQALLEKGSAADAAALLQEPLTLFPDEPAFRALLSQALFDIGCRTDRTMLQQARRECLAFIDQARNRDSPQVANLLGPVWMLLVEIAIEQGDWFEVERAAAGYLAIHPEDEWACLSRAEALLRTDRAREAIGLLTGLTESHRGGDFPALLLLDALASNHDTDGIRDRLSAWRAAEPDRALPHIIAGIWLLRLSDPDQAISAFERALTIEPGLSVAAECLVDALFRVGRGPEAVRRMEGIVGTSGNKSDMRAILARARLQIDPLDGKARDALKEAIARGIPSLPQRLAAYAVLMQCLTRQGQAAAVILTGRQALDQDAGSPRPGTVVAQPLGKIHLLLGLANSSLGHLDAAEFHYRRAISVIPEDPVPKNNLASLLLRGSRGGEEPVQLAREATASRPEVPEFRSTLADALHSAGLHAEAATEYQYAIEAYARTAANPWSPDDRNQALAAAWVGRARCLAETGSAAEAAAALKEAVRIAPGLTESAEVAALRKLLGE